MWVAEECEAGLVSPSRKDLIWTWLLSFIGERGGRFIGCYLWSSLFTWWVAENEKPPQQTPPPKRRGHRRGGEEAVELQFRLPQQ